MPVSVVVCTYNRAALLGACLDSLLAQERPADEIWVVDNNSTDATAQVVAERARRWPQLRYLLEPRQGVTHARNAGLQAASSEICAFIDDDEEAPPDWLARLLARFDELGEEAVAVAGEVTPIWGAPRPRWLTDEMLEIYSARVSEDQQPRWASDAGWLAEGNIAYRRQPLLEAGGFPSTLGRVGARLMAGEGVVNKVLQAAGHRLFTDPAILVSHHIHANRLTRRWVHRRAFWQGVTQWAIDNYLYEQGVEPHIHQRGTLHQPMTPAVWLYRPAEQDREAAFQLSLKHLWRMGYVAAMTGALDDQPP